MSDILLDILVFTSLGMLGMGVFFKHRDRYVLRSAGYVLFGLFWLLRVGEAADSGDMVNTVFVALAFPFFGFLAYKEISAFQVLRSGKEYDKNPGLEMLAGAVFFGGLVYFAMAKIPPISGAVISLVTSHTVSLANLLGGTYSAGELIFPMGNAWYAGGFSAAAGVVAPIYNINSLTPLPRVYIEFACTGVQSILIFMGPILFTRSAQIKKKLKVAAFFAVLIYGLNLIRNIGILYMIDNTGIDPHFAHDIIGKAGSLIALFILAFIVFKMLPGLLDEVDELILMFTRRKQRSLPEGPSPPLQESQEE